MIHRKVAILAVLALFSGCTSAQDDYRNQRETLDGLTDELAELMVGYEHQVDKWIYCGLMATDAKKRGNDDAAAEWLGYEKRRAALMAAHLEEINPLESLVKKQRAKVDAAKLKL